MDSAELYQQRTAGFQTSFNLIEKSIRQYGFARLSVAIVIIILIYFGFKETLSFYAIPLPAILFFSLVQKQSKKEEERKIVLRLIELNQCEAAAGTFDFRNFPDGERFVDPHHSYSHDLDIFGKSSLFQYINRCSTKLGENRLAVDLKELKLDKQVIFQRQEAIHELAPLIDFRQRCWAAGRQIQDADFNLESLWQWLKGPSLFYGKKSRSLVRWVLPCVTCLFLLGANLNPIFRPFFFFMLLLQLTISSFYNRPITKLQEQLSVYRKMLENYAKIFRLAHGQSFTSFVMKGHHRVASEAVEHVKKFSSLINALESRLNVFARIVGNGLFLYDFHAVINLEEWRAKHRSTLPQWMESLAEWDALLSFAAFHYNYPHYVFAEINESLSIHGKQVGHPMIPPAMRVNNDFNLGDPEGVMLITGANMAGKSTFLRTVGVNYLLASNGAPVCATKWSSPLIELRSGMRTSDSLQEHQSYFYAELNRLQSIIKDLRTGKSLLILLDEILKGTNSTDKQTGSRELIKQLIDQKALVLIATHDIALGDMEQQYPGRIITTCFEGQIENDQLTFDYKLNRGLALRANATFLMRMMGIIPS
jgi:hypothetical protein